VKLAADTLMYIRLALPVSQIKQSKPEPFIHAFLLQQCIPLLGVTRLCQDESIGSNRRKLTVENE
jgi:hypothetical protein